MRLDRFLSNAGYGSRSDVKEMIRSGQVRIGGKICRDPACGVPDGSAPSAVSLNGQPVSLQRQVTLMMNKPAGVITAMDDPRHPTVAGLIPPRWRAAGLFPVGRLDIDTTGLLLLTNDGVLCHRLASPRWEVWKTYEVAVDGKIFDTSDISTFAAGIPLADGQVCRPAKLTIQGSQLACLTIHEGRFHQVKRMMLATGRRVSALRRLSIGPLALDETLAPGQCRPLTPAEAASLYALVELTPEPGQPAVAEASFSD